MPFTGTESNPLTTMQTLLNSFWSVLSAIYGQITNVISVITSNPLLLIPTGVALAYLCVRIFRRFIVAA